MKQVEIKLLGLYIRLRIKMKTKTPHCRSEQFQNPIEKKW